MTPPKTLKKMRPSKAGGRSFATAHPAGASKHAKARQQRQQAKARKPK
jgi:hypothetical protein